MTIRTGTTAAAAAWLVIIATVAGCHAGTMVTAQSTPTSSRATLISVEPKPFQVAAPEDPDGGNGEKVVHCLPDQISGSATTRPAARGVDGVINLRGDHCPIPVGSGIDGLLDADGATLPIPVERNLPQYSNAALNHLGILAFLAGRVSYGFAWNGSWCGAAATAVRMRIGSHMIVVPLTGPGPRCEGNSRSDIADGTFGWIGDRVQAGPSDWQDLTVSVQGPERARKPKLRHLTFTISNATGANITLSPTPAYALSIVNVDLTYRHDDLLVRRVPLTTTNVVPAHGALTFALPTIDLTADWSQLRGHAFYMYVAIATATNTSAIIEARSRHAKVARSAK